MQYIIFNKFPKEIIFDFLKRVEIENIDDVRSKVTHVLFIECLDLDFRTFKLLYDTF